MKLACNYAIARFLPYPETGEFVNIGVVLMCPQVHFFGYQLARRRRRVTDFFRELELSIYRSGLRHFEEELEFITTAYRADPKRDSEDAHAKATEMFRSLVRPRESLFRFSDVRTVLAADPTAKLEELFDYYVDRQFARDKEYQETLMANHLRQVFTRTDLARLYRNESVGNERYEVPLPFVHRRQDRVVKAIKPLDLDKESSTKVYEHGDQWITRVRRLREIGEMPGELLFAIRPPRGGVRRTEAGREIVGELERLETRVIPYTDEAAVVEFAKVA